MPAQPTKRRLQDLDDVQSGVANGQGYVFNGSLFVPTDLATQAELTAHESDTTGVHGIADTSALVVDGDAVGGDLAGTFPNPTIPVGKRLRSFYRSGLFYTGYGTANTFTVTNNREYWHAFTVSEPVTFDRIGVNVATAAGGSTCRIGLFADDGNGQPAALTTEYGSVDCSTTGDKLITVSLSFVPGTVYWFSALPQGGTPVLGGLTSVILPQTGRGSADSVSAGWFRNNVTGAMPDPANPDGSSITPIVRVSVRAA